MKPEQGLWIWLDPEKHSDLQRCEARRISDGALPDGQRKVLLMHTVEGLSYEEISRITGMNNLTLRVLLSQARKKLKLIK